MIPFKTSSLHTVSNSTMQEIYEKIKTPYKYGAVLKFNEDMCDSPSVFSYNDKWYMSFIKISYNTQTSGYDSHLAESNDLVNWNYLFKTLERTNDASWDSKQIACYPAFIENDFYGNYKIQSVNGKYHFAYLGGCLDGYETDPLAIGQSTTTHILSPSLFTKSKKPILAPSDKDVRVGETLTLYKSNMFIDKAKTLGYSYVNAYNAKGENHKESIYLAVSNDGENWERYGEKAILYDTSLEQNYRILGDPQIVKLDNVYIMFYFVLKDGKAFNTFACSYDLINWTRWNGKNLIESEFEWEDMYAHKTWIVVKDGIIYHYYCACNNKGERFIALATSKKIQ